VKLVFDVQVLVRTKNINGFFQGKVINYLEGKYTNVISIIAYISYIIILLNYKLLLSIIVSFPSFFIVIAITSLSPQITVQLSNIHQLF